MSPRLRTVLTVATFVLIAVLMLFGEHGYLAQRDDLQAIAALEERNRTLAEQNERLRGEIVALRGDTAAIERMARETLGMQYPGERPVRVVTVGDTPDAPR